MYIMRSKEPLVNPKSEFFFYIPSTVATKVYLYPVVAGRFFYDPGYYLKRSNYDNFLLMHIDKGELTLNYGDRKQVVPQGKIVLLDCHQPHEYGNLTQQPLVVSWLHFDGVLARQYYDLATTGYGNVITPPNPYPFTHNLEKIYRLFANAAPIRENDMSRYITTMLSELVTVHNSTPGETSRSEIIENTMAYINEHFRENLSLQDIADYASLSPYYFTRVFTAETGFTPHQYLIATRISFAKYLLQSGEMPVKEIAFNSGFSSESAFCSTFRKREKVTPGEYRAGIRK